MAEEFEKLKAEWDVCESKMSTLFGELASAAQTEANLKDWLGGAREDLVDRALAARKAGVAGQALSDFLKDAGVKGAWTQIQASMVKLGAAHDRFQSTVPKFGPLHAEALKIAKKADDEVAAPRRAAPRSGWLSSRPTKRRRSPKS